MNIAILGYGIEGESAYKYWNKPGNTVTICDQNPLANAPSGAQTKIGGDYLRDLEQYDIIVRSPGIHPNDIVQANPDHPEIAKKMTSVINEFLKVCSVPVIGVTGTKGKGTTSSLIATILKTAGKTTHIGGNIGTPALDLLPDIKKDDWVVLELSSFQLFDLQTSPKIAVCLMIVPEHLNWHPDMYEYIRSKEQLFIHQKPGDIAVYNVRNDYSEEIADASPGQKIPYDVPPEDGELIETEGAYVDGDHIKMRGVTACKVDDVLLRGRHNLENVCAAIAATWDVIGQDTKVIKKAVSSFPGLQHRQEVVGEHNGVWYVDDSFGTTPETAVVALQAFEQTKVLIVGGSDKGADFSELAHAIASSDIRHVVAIGDTGPKILAMAGVVAGKRKIPSTVLSTDVTMTDIVAEATKHAKKGDVVLLSTGCASFGMFANYKERGEKFKAAFKALAQQSN